MYSYRRKPWRQWLATASWRPHGPSITLWRKDISRMLSRNCGEGICSCAPQWRETLSELWFLFLPFSNPYYKVKTYTIVQYTYSWLTRAASKYRASKKTSWAVTGLWNREPLRVLNDIKLTLKNHKGHSDSFIINLESFRTFTNQYSEVPKDK